MKKLFIFTVILLLGILVYGRTTYHIGPGQTYTSLGALPWLDLVAGDSVLIHWRTDPYREKIGLRSRGSESMRIVISGIPNSAGELPVISGENATTSHHFDDYFSAEWDEYLGSILIKPEHADPWGYKPGYITIENLKFIKAHPSSTYYDVNGAAHKFDNGAGAIWAVIVEHFIVRNCVITDNANGLFVLSKGGMDLGGEEVSSDVLVEKNYIYGNGNVGRDREHNIYIQANGVTYQYNRIGRLRDNAIGSSLKDRSANTVVRYNWIESSARAIDFVEAEDAPGILMQNPEYHNIYVYGNIIINNTSLGEPFSTSMIHYGGDTYEDNILKKGTLYFYNNTVFIKSQMSVAYYLRLFDCTSNQDTVVLYNNIAYRAGDSEFYLMNDYGVANIKGFNWINLTQDSRAGFLGSVIKSGTILSSGTPGFANENGENFSLISTSACLNKSVALPSIPNTKYPLSMEYQPHLKGKQKIITGTSIDLGAFEYSNGTFSGTQQILNSELECFPNPASGYINIKFQYQGYVPVTLKIADITGKVVLRKEVDIHNGNIYNVDISKLSEGLYLIIIDTCSKRFVKKIQVY